MTLLLWARTKRRLNTYEEAEVDSFLDDIRATIGAGVDRPFEGGDQLLATLHVKQSTMSISRLVAHVMQGDFIDDWSVTEVGGGVGPAFEQETFRDAAGRVHTLWDFRFIDPNDLQLDDGNDFETNDLPFLPDLVHLDWRLHYDVQRKTGLWVDFEEDLEPSRYLVTSLERALPGKPMKMWHGRSSMLFAYHSHHDTRKAFAYGLNEAVRKVLDDERVAYWLAFQIGNQSEGGVLGAMNPVRDFIWKSSPRRTLPNATGKATGPGQPKRPVVVVEKRTRVVAVPSRLLGPPRRGGRQ